ncbi:hypothetical protein LOK49_LG07G00969 [Camellia lanceoleosa]|uniref:Uncharacterized protein n=1 Tax=Camellia lanceoleosa TaxID=1840588 RepID=A0ACC0GWP8_9ERIC|nr:hypothetical protein LOK49_LG07G00969 [Camellia lanceoleosa]
MDETKFFEASRKGNLIPLRKCILSDDLTPVLAYRCLVKEDDQETPSFLFESVGPGSSCFNCLRYGRVQSRVSGMEAATADRQSGKSFSGLIDVHASIAGRSASREWDESELGFYGCAGVEAVGIQRSRDEETLI